MSSISPIHQLKCFVQSSVYPHILVVYLTTLSCALQLTHAQPCSCTGCTGTCDRIEGVCACKSDDDTDTYTIVFVVIALVFGVGVCAFCIKKCC